MEAMFKETACLSLGELKAYHKGKLNGVALRRVEQHLIDCPLCDGALEGINSSLNPVQDQIQLRKLGKATRTSNRPLPVFFNKAVAVLLIFIIATAFLTYWQQTKGERIFAEFYTTPVYEGSLQRGSAEAAINAPIKQKAIIAFGQKDYAQAVDLLEAHISDQANDFEAIFYAGISQLEERNIEKAIQYLQKTRLNDGDQYEGATWYLALAYVRQKEYEKASLLAEEIKMSSDPIYRMKAVALLEKMGNKYQ